MFYYWINDDFSFLSYLFSFPALPRRYDGTVRPGIKREKRHETFIWWTWKGRKNALAETDHFLHIFIHSSCFLSSSSHVWMMSFLIDFPSFVWISFFFFTIQGFRCWSMRKGNKNRKRTLYSLQYGYRRWNWWENAKMWWVFHIVPIHVLLHCRTISFRWCSSLIQWEKLNLMSF